MNRVIAIAAVFIALLAGIATAFLVTRGEPPPALDRATLFEASRPLPEFALVDQGGARFDADRLRDRWTLLFFGFTHCPDVCPTTLATLAEVRRQLADLPPAARPEVVLVSVDPARDTPELLARYVRHFDPAFTGATGSPEAIGALTRDLGVAVFVGAPAGDGNYTVDHSAAVFLVDPSAAMTALFGTPHEAGAIARDYRRIVAARAR